MRVVEVLLIEDRELAKIVNDGKSDTSAPHVAVTMMSRFKGEEEKRNILLEVANSMVTSDRRIRL